MTSRNSFFDLMVEDLKRRVWVIALAMLTFFFFMTLPAAMVVGDYDYSSGTDRVLKMTSYIVDCLSSRSPLLILIMVVGAFICSLSGFSYLNSKKKVDFYHSIPVRREKLFAVYYLDGILIAAFAYGINLAVSLLIAFLNGADRVWLLEEAAAAAVVHMTGFCLLYSTITAAVMMTGNMLVAILGSGVFFSYLPMIHSVAEGYCQTWLSTYSYYNTAGNPLLGGASTYMAYINLSALSGDPGGFLPIAAHAAGCFAAAAAFTALALVLYRFRPSEAAGKALAFPRTKTIIRVLLVIPIGLSGGLFFWNMRDSMFWAVFGISIAAVVSHCVIEILYHFDFRRLFNHWLQMILCTAVCLLTLIGFRLDLMGFDSYRPGESSVEWAAICMDGLDGWVDYGRYVRTEEYVFEHMRLTDVKDVLAIADEGIRKVRSDKSSESLQDVVESEPYYSEVYVKYHLKSGQTAVRRYYMDLNRVADSVERIYDSPEYKNGIFPILRQKAEYTDYVTYQEQELRIELKLGGRYGAEEERQLAELLTVYQSELADLTIATRRQESPVGSIQFADQVLRKAARELEESDQWGYEDERRTLCFYPIYPSFTRTLAILESQGIHPGAEMNEIIGQVRSVIIKDQDWETGEDLSHTFDDPEQIRAILSAAISKSSRSMNRLNEVDSYHEITAILGSWEPGIPYYLDRDRIPAFLKLQLQYPDEEISGNPGT